MDIPVDIIGPVIAYLTGVAKSSLTDGAKSFSENTGANLWEIIKGRFHKDEQKELINELEKQPSDPSLQSQFSDEVKELLTKNPDFMKELESYIQKNHLIVTGDSNISIQNVNGSTITLNR